jgi:hypothetical protein
MGGFGSKLPHHSEAEIIRRDDGCSKALPDEPTS